MSGYNLVREVHRLEKEVELLGLVMCYPKTLQTSRGDDYVALKPRDTSSVPVYARDAEVFVGTLSELRQWLQGVTWDRDYDRMLNITTDKRRVQGEDRIRAQQERTRIKLEQKRLWEILRDQK